MVAHGNINSLTVTDVLPLPVFYWLNRAVITAELHISCTSTKFMNFIFKRNKTAYKVTQSTDKATSKRNSKGNQIDSHPHT